MHVFMMPRKYFTHLWFVLWRDVIMRFVGSSNLNLHSSLHEVTYQVIYTVASVNNCLFYALF